MKYPAPIDNRTSKYKSYGNSEIDFNKFDAPQDEATLPRRSETCGIINFEIDTVNHHKSP